MSAGPARSRYSLLSGPADDPAEKGRRHIRPHSIHDVPSPPASARKPAPRKKSDDRDDDESGSDDFHWKKRMRMTRCRRLVCGDGQSRWMSCEGTRLNPFSLFSRSSLTLGIFDGKHVRLGIHVIID